MESCLIIGAGLSGLVVAQTLQERGLLVTVLEKEDKVGGRMRTDRIQDGVFDHGAQFFTVRSCRFGEMVEAWISAGIAQEWARGFADPTGEYREDGHARYKGKRGMTGIAEYLARDLNVCTHREVNLLQRDEQSWKVVAGNATYYADTLILAAPSALALAESSGIALPSEARSDLEKIRYDPCIAVMALLDGPGKIPAPGGLQIGGDPLFWVADNRKKGISKVPAVTIHAGPQFSREHLNSDDDKISGPLLEEAKDYIGTGVKAIVVYRWKHSAPIQIHEEPFVYVGGPPPLVFCGDAYAGPKVEGAVLSGLAAAEKLLESR
ncbi:MAG: FAD-dependent oxidoreductase [Actinomycetota bacterium]|nr:FAD-dependent oxidoreductase [Actinomycetota bacterium]